MLLPRKGDGFVELEEFESAFSAMSAEASSLPVNIPLSISHVSDSAMDLWHFCSVHKHF